MISQFIEIEPNVWKGINTNHDVVILERDGCTLVINDVYHGWHSTYHEAVRFAEETVGWTWKFAE